MVFDRTQTDVSEAKRIREEKVKNFEELSAEEISIMERGSLSINTLNRIEEKQSELKGIFNSLGYWNTPVINKRWTNTDVFYKSDFERLLNNLNILKNAFFVFVYTPKTPSLSFGYQTINDIEKILYDLENKISELRGYIRECNTFYCGEVNNQ